MLTLNISDTDVTTGSVPITWCLDNEDIKNIMESFDNDPIVLIVVAPQQRYSARKEIRYIVPLKDLMTYISFKRPGPNKIFAAVLDMDIKTARDVFLRKYDREYLSHALNYEGTKIQHSKFNETSLDVNVPEEAFAPEPPQWEKDWVLWLVSDKGLDQCDFRKRKIFAYTLQPIIFALNYLFRALLIFISASLLLESCSLKLLTKPLQNNLCDSFDLFYERCLAFGETRESGWKLTNQHSCTFKNYTLTCWYSFTKFGGLLFLPVLWLCVFALYHFFGAHVIISLGIFCAINIFLLILVGALGTLVGKIAWTFIKRDVKEKTKNTDNVSKNKTFFNKKEIEYIACNPVNMQPSYVKVEALPIQKRSIKLRYQQLKSKICRPFPG